MSMKIVVRTKEHRLQRYNTVGDWQYGLDGSMQISVSNLGNWRMEMLVAVHEIIEQTLCKARLIPEAVVDQFDRDFGDAPGEPGDAPGCPYRREHFFATSIERLLAAELNIDWNEYERQIDAL